MQAWMGGENSSISLHMVSVFKPLLQGLVCANPCPSGSYGSGCKKKCECYNGAGCDPLNGNCHCKPGYQGSKVRVGGQVGPITGNHISLFQCHELCPLGSYGSDCKETCQCLNDGSCNPEDGSCNCAHGWKGDICEARSCNATGEDWLYGKHCSLPCKCHPNNTEM